MSLQTGETFARKRQAKMIEEREKEFSPDVNKYIVRQRQSPERTHVKICMTKRRILPDGLEEWSDPVIFDVDATSILPPGSAKAHARAEEKKRAKRVAAADGPDSAKQRGEEKQFVNIVEPAPEPKTVVSDTNE